MYIFQVFVFCVTLFRDVEILFVLGFNRETSAIQIMCGCKRLLLSQFVHALSFSLNKFGYRNQLFR